ncbi:MAG: glycosyltransferase family 2 protein [Acidobacteria bacterium]|nr:glycosyltransferase family 2 protein [Acidobacteriota bacterium]
MNRTLRSSVCAIIVHHRGSGILARCLESLLASEGVALEIVVVANACQEALPSLVEAHPRVHVIISERSVGFSAANNLGARWARTHLPAHDYLFFVNNDTIAEPDALRRLIVVMAATPERVIAGPRLMIWGAPRVLNSLGINITLAGEAWDEGIGRPLEEFQPLPVCREVIAVTGAALMMRTTAYETLGGWEDLYGYYFEDIDLCLRARSRGWEVVVVGDAVVHHAISATAVRGSDMKRQLSWRNRFLLMMIHWPAPLLLSAGSSTAARELRLAGRRLRARAWPDLRLQVRSWLGSIKRWPRAWSLRRALGGDQSWTGFLEAHGTVPVIRLPDLPDDALIDSGDQSA